MPTNPSAKSTTNSPIAAYSIISLPVWNFLASPEEVMHNTPPQTTTNGAKAKAMFLIHLTIIMIRSAKVLELIGLPIVPVLLPLGNVTEAELPPEVDPPDELPPEVDPPPKVSL